ncbi:MAG TPA: BMP family ABC transporter substrate-binding protein [Candidatus Pullichristensenella excrementigallinarum]|uniref:BMP family ABC transporter substrate-binding protein n=1 Tax=Candidatus Pullichristensenella excrementigallinarum TaxID=2840907 RepID=A0A9D1LCL3_9FIRM|nr:BMP family ABC transporter substrate-binding protein [Candidatus Pullichristensenella excrementigallinarum]
MKKLFCLVLTLALAFAISSSALAFEPVPADEIKVGFVYIGDPSDKGYTLAHHEGTLAMQEALGLRDDQILIKTFVTEDSACETAIRELIEQGCSVIFGNSFGFGTYMAELAEEYPEVIFLHCSGNLSNDVNFSNYFGRIWEARYLAGIAAGLRTENNHLGYVAAMQIPECIYSMNAYFLGAKSVNPDVTMDVLFTNTWYDPTIEGQAAKALIDKGCDVIAQHQDTTMPVAAAEEAGVWACGYNCDMTEDGPHAHLTAPIWNWGIYVTEQVQAVIDGTWAPENQLKGMADGWVDISPLTENCAEGTEEAVEAAKEAIMSGELQIFTGEIVDNAGNVVVAEGQTLTDEEILQITWFCEGITIN